MWRTRDEQLLPEVGLDAIFFLKFARLVRPGGRRLRTLPRVHGV